MKLGFIGTGGITTILVNGFLAKNNGLEIIVSPRNAERAESLLEKFPTNLSIAKNNQEIVDQSDYVFLCVKPEIAEEVVRPLIFGKKHQMINLVAGLPLETLKLWLGDIDLLVHAIPMSFAAHGYGPIVLFPDEIRARKLLELIGDVFAVDNEEDVRILQAITSVQASFYTLLDSVVNWGIGKGLSTELATSYTSSLFMAFTKFSQDIDKEGLAQLSEEMTPKGLNWTTKTNLLKENAIDAWPRSLDLVMDRLRLE